jgi:Ferric reductase like transmembrane component
MILATAPKALWYFTRGSGAVALVLLTISFALGLLTLLGWASDSAPRLIVQGLHKNVSLLVMVFLGLHIVTAVADGFVPLRWIDAFVPFTSRYRAAWLGLGAVAFDLLLALIVTSLLRVRIGYTAWKIVHWTAYACWPLALVHAFGTGSDARQGWFQVLAFACLIGVMASVGWRLTARRLATPRGRGVAFGTFVLAPVAIVIWTFTGPMQRGWGHVSRKAPVSTSALAQGFEATFRGTAQTVPNGGAEETLQIDASLPASVPTVLEIRLDGTPTADGGMRMRTGEVDVGPTADPQQWTGTVTSYENGRLAAQLVDKSGTSLGVTIVLRLEAGATASGTVTARPVGGGA